jgi:uncharacterized delta-60 repeat protein
VKTRIRPQVDSLEGRTLLSAGDLDLTFGGTGIVATSIGSWTNQSTDLLVQPDGKVVQVGSEVPGTASSGSMVAMVRYNVDGTRDASFGTSGVVTTGIGQTINGTYGDHVSAVALDPSTGKIVVVGQAYPTKNVLSYGFMVARYNPNGTLDTTFNHTGYEVTKFASYASNRVIVQGDGKIVASMDGVTNFSLVRFNTDGTMDASFGTGGLVTGSKPSAYPGGNSVLYALAYQPADGKILATGNVYTTSGLPNTTFALARYNPNGTLDTTFGPNHDGTVITYLGGTYADAHGIVLQPDGKVVIAGQTATSGTTSTLYGSALARYNPDGTLDPSFGSGGVVQTNTVVHANHLVLLADGNFMVEAMTNDASGTLIRQFALARFTPSGVFDTTFGTNGVVTTYVGANGNPNSIALAPDGKVVLGGSVNRPIGSGNSNQEFVAARYLGDTPPPASLAAHASAPATLTATATDPTLIPLVLDDPVFLSSVAKNNRRHA